MKKTLIIVSIILTLGVFSYVLITSQTVHKFTKSNISQIPDSYIVVPQTPNTPTIVVTPTVVIQGEPVMIHVENLSATSSVQSVQEITFSGTPVKFFLYDSKPTAFVPIDLNHKIGEYNVDAKLNDGTVLKSSLKVLARVKSIAPLGIPAKLGGNSTTSQNNLINNLNQENAAIKALPTSVKALWSQGFQDPIKNPIITDPYGYTRLTGVYTVSHLGVDFRADVGASVMAMNRGVIKYASTTVVYGKMIVIDHGLGLQTLYLHLSKINVTEGQLVEKGQIIGESGQTGYAEQPHLHISIKINKISIDPIKFLNFFK